jgi:uncharacterized protein
MEFENQQILACNLPDFTDAIPEKLEKNYLWVMLITRLISAIIIITGASVTVLFIRSEKYEIIKILVFGIMFIFSFFYLISTKKAFNRKSYSIRQNDLIFSSGLLFRSVTIIPYNRIQHAELTIGPIEKLFKLCSLKVFTAGGSQSDIIIPGLNPEKANKIKSFVISKTSSHEEF